MNGVATVSERKICVSPATWPSLTKGGPATAASECPNCQQQKPIHHCLRKRIGHLGTSWLYWLLSSLKESVVTSHKDRYHRWGRVCLSCPQNLILHYCVGLTGCLIPSMESHIVQRPLRGFTSHRRKFEGESMTRGIHWFSHTLYYSKAAMLMERWNNLL